MGKLLSGHYGHPPDAESIDISLKECNQKLNLKPSDFVSVGAPTFFKKAYGARGRYLLFLLPAEELEGNPIWKEGYYLLPLEAADVLDALERHKGKFQFAAEKLPIKIQYDGTPPPKVVERAEKWADKSQPLFFKCRCTALELELIPPWALRRHWKARLRCPKRCVPPLTTLL
jgi:hypothetical protein